MYKPLLSLRFIILQVKFNDLEKLLMEVYQENTEGYQTVVVHLNRNSTSKLKLQLTV